MPAAAAAAKSAKAAAAHPPAAKRTPLELLDASPASRAVSLCVTIVERPVKENND